MSTTTITSSPSVEDSHKTLAGVKSYSIVSRKDSTTQRLAECLKKNHRVFAALRDPQLLFHNHMPHILGSAYYLGATPEKLTEICNVEGESLRAVETVPQREALTTKTWKQHLGDKSYTVSFVRFFDDEIKAAGGDWQRVVREYLYSTDTPLINGFCGGLGHPFIHLHYAYEFDSVEVASEALSLGCTEYDFVHRYFDSPSADTSTYKTRHLKDVLLRVQQDKRFDDHFELPGFMNTFTLHAKCEAAILEHYNAWDLTDYSQQFEDSFDFAVRLAVGTGSSEAQHDFFLIHVLTVAHALRVILPNAPDKHRNPILRQFVMWTIVIYCAQLRPAINSSSIQNSAIDKYDWAWVQEKALTGKWSLDSHYVKVVRALKFGADMYGEKDGWYLKAAVRFITDFHGWSGFGVGVEGMEGAVH